MSGVAPTTDSGAATRQAGLRHVSDAAPGIRRRRAGKGFYYLDANGERIVAPATLERIRALAIPPAYRDVWICAQANGHLQATGRDARGRKQYRYHPRWRQVRDEHKFSRLVAFGSRLGRLRRHQEANLALRGMPQQKVIAIAVALMEHTFIRVGNREYARDNHSYGLTTLGTRHVAFSGGKVRLRFRGKGGKDHDIPITDRRLGRLLRRCHELPGKQLFSYVDDDGNRHDVDSGMINDYLRDVMGEPFTAKDFRTWGGTMNAAAILAAIAVPADGGAAAITAAEAGAVRDVAALMGNTPAICRRAYIHPAVFQCWRTGDLAHAIPAGTSVKDSAALEKAVLKLLRNHG